MAQKQVDNMKKNLVMAFTVMKEPLPTPPEDFMDEKESTERAEIIISELLKLPQDHRRYEAREQTEILDQALDMEFDHARENISGNDISQVEPQQLEPPVFLSPTVEPMDEDIDFGIYLQ